MNNEEGFFIETGDSMLRFKVEGPDNLSIDHFRKSGKGLKHIPACHLELTKGQVEKLADKLKDSLKTMEDQHFSDVAFAMIDRLLKAEATRKEKQNNKLLDAILAKQGHKCILCGKPIEGRSHDAWPCAEGRCCTMCNETKVGTLRKKGKWIQFADIMPGNVLEIFGTEGREKGQVRSIISRTPTKVTFKYLILAHNKVRTISQLRTGEFPAMKEVYRIQ